MAAHDDRVGDRPVPFTETPRFHIRALKARYRDHRPELATLTRHIEPGDIVCDIGAHKGSFTYWLSRWCGVRGGLPAAAGIGAPAGAGLRRHGIA